MADFQYLAMSPSGKQVKASLSADSVETARSMLKSQGLTVIEVNEASAMNKDIKLPFGNKVKARDIGVFCRSMNSVLNAGVPVVRALDMLTEQTEKKSLQEAVAEAQQRVEKGESLADAMRGKEKIFPKLLVSLVQAGEESGSLDLTFSRMAEHFEKRARLSGLVKKAMIYPAVILTVIFIIVGIMSTMVIPQFAEMFEGMGTELPWITKFVMGISGFVMSRWYILIILAVIASVAIKTYLATDNGKHVWGRISIKAPIFGSIVVKSNAANFTRTLSTLTGSGMDLPRSMEITAESLTNIIFEDAIKKTKEEVEQGVPMSLPLKASNIFPPMVYQMISIGEETGQLEDMLEKVAEYYEEEVEMAVGSLTAAMEPLIIVILGVIVGFLALALYMPMVSMYEGMDSL